MLTIATSQFPISAEVSQNLAHIIAQMQEAKNAQCDLIHFAECALSGYVGVDFECFDGYDWAELKKATQAVMQKAAELGLWVVLGSSHPLTAPHKAHNSLYIINSKGELVDRYDKRFCAGDDTEATAELAHFSPGNHVSVFELNGMKLGCLICHEYRYPELYRDLKQRGVQLVLHSFHAGNMDKDRQAMMEAEVGEAYHAINPGKTLPEITMPSTMISYAANNALWISCANTSAAQSCWPAFAVRPDGVIVGKLEKNEASILLTEIDPTASFYDSTKYWRIRAINGQFHSGTLVQDARSDDRRGL